MLARFVCAREEHQRGDSWEVLPGESQKAFCHLPHRSPLSLLRNKPLTAHPGSPGLPEEFLVLLLLKNMLGGKKVGMSSSVFAFPVVSAVPRAPRKWALALLGACARSSGLGVCNGA